MGEAGTKRVLGTDEPVSQKSREWWVELARLESLAGEDQRNHDRNGKRAGVALSRRGSKFCLCITCILWAQRSVSYVNTIHTST